MADTWNQRIQVFDATLNYLRKWPVYGLGWHVGGQQALSSPWMPRAIVYVTDPEGYRVLKFDPQGKLLAVVGTVR